MGDTDSQTDRQIKEIYCKEMPHMTIEAKKLKIYSQQMRPGEPVCKS